MIMMAKLWQMINMFLQYFTEYLTWGETVLFRSPREHSAHHMYDDYYDLPNLLATPTIRYTIYAGGCQCATSFTRLLKRDSFNKIY
jgi:adenosine deaminase